MFDFFPLFLLRHMVECLVDSRKMEEAASYVKVTEEFINLYVPHLYRRLFLIQVSSISSDLIIWCKIFCSSIGFCLSLAAVYNFLTLEQETSLNKKALISVCKCSEAMEWHSFNGVVDTCNNTLNLFMKSSLVLLQG